MATTEEKIPEDVWEDARQIWNGMQNNSLRDARVMIARAILAERERCAEIVKEGIKYGFIADGTTISKQIYNLISDPK